MNRKKRDKNLIFKVNEDEWNIIQKRLEKCNVSNMSDLFRQMMLYGIYLEYNHEELKKYGRRLCVWQTTSIKLHTE